MSVYYDRDHREMILSCDNDSCNEESTFYGAWPECINESREEGWKAWREHSTGAWFHHCPTCKNAGADATEVFR